MCSLLKPHPPGKSRKSGLSDTSKGSSKGKASAQRQQDSAGGRSSPSVAAVNQQGTRQMGGEEENQLTVRIWFKNV